ncbi:DUF2268 domain-containing protein [Nonomuraea soli]|uniref:Uncharacterized protein YjaZ n=1 Tax=Nonomuraea soli TaxID=1032476 RepID=A0A7W0CH56_9ACTN|nr:DUF2268 domain-containing putative Zn-dependent protease [Nonomuraea soli]MBA2891090.1 uncharacterized protein YjaZ [Nonomuraea soli]
MKLIIHDTLSATADLLRRPLEERPQALREMLAPIRELIPMPGDHVDIHHQGGGFRVDRDDPRYLAAVEDLAGLPGEIEEEIGRALAHLKAVVPGIEHPQELQVMFVLGNPDDEHLMRTSGGYYGMGSSPGWLYLLAWPGPGVRERIKHCAVHEFHHQVRYMNVEWNPVTVTVGEHLVAEGLAEAFVRELSGPEAMGPWSGMVTGAEFDRALELTMAAIDLEGMMHTPAYVLGDSAITRFGGEPRGIPDMAGYAVGLHLVDLYLAQSGSSVAAASVLPAARILTPEVRRLSAARG